jgi:very-short-patch-repair endonuclease
MARKKNASNRGLTVRTGRTGLPKINANLSLRPRVLERKVIDSSYVLQLAADSEFGGNNFERAADGAAHVRRHRFDAAQYYHPISLDQSYTLIDRMVFHPLQAVYLDGPQHRMRPDNAAKDILQEIQLIHDGFKVVRITDTEFMNDPVGVIDRKINWMGSGNTLSDYNKRTAKLPPPVGGSGLDPDKHGGVGIGLGDAPRPDRLTHPDESIQVVLEQLKLENGDIAI